MNSRFTAQSMRHSAGFTLLEVLIAVVVFSIGLIGVASMQAYSLQSNNSSFLRSQATAVGYEIIDAARANRMAVIRSGSVDSAVDVDELVTSRLPDGVANTSVNGEEVVVTVAWLDDRSGESGESQGSVQLRSDI